MQTLLLVSWTWTNFSDRAFSAARPRVWNYLLPDSRQPDLSDSRFTQSLKTSYLVSGTKAPCQSSFNCALQILLLTNLTYLGTYLLTYLEQVSKIWETVHPKTSANNYCNFYPSHGPEPQRENKGIHTLRKSRIDFLSCNFYDLQFSTPVVGNRFTLIAAGL